MVSYQLSAGQRHLYRIKEPGMYCRHTYGIP